MATVQTPDWRKILVRGLIAGLIGGVLIDAFLYCAVLLPMHQPVTVMWQSIAANAIGKDAAANPNAAWLGLLMHFVTSAAWGCAFSYVAHTREQVPAHPWLSGLVFGAIVMIIMNIVTMTANGMPPLTVQFLVVGLTAHCIFFGLPVSLYISRTLRN